MTSNYEVIREENVREYGEGTRHLAFLGRLYTDRTHFIFELLQNAEDAKATKIRFDLFEDRLEVRHDGRLFNERDVRGICGVDEGTKAEDLTQIGKFGIGFKSVYAYTTAPEVHSGDEHFRIEHYVRPHQASLMHSGGTWTTLFIFPFDISDLAPTICQNEIAGRLRNLNARTLLFLRNTGEIEYTLPDESGGTYLREVTQRGIAKQVLVIGQNNGVEEDETWLVFERSVSVPAGGDKVCVEIAFRLQNSTDDQVEKVVKIDDSPLIVYFPTEKLTRLGFLVQGPYRTTPSRDNIPKDDDWNTELIRETAVLATDALAHLKGMGLMTISLLQALPIRASDFPKDGMFYSIAQRIRGALRDQDLLAADDGSFVSARNARLARSGDLRKLLTNTQLRDLLQSSDQLKWLSGDITQDRTPELRSFLMNELGVNEIDPESFARNLSEDFLASRDDDWFARFYEFLLEQESLWRKPKYVGQARGVLRSKSIIRLEDDTLVVPFDSTERPSAYLPIDGMDGFRFVKQSIVCNEQALKFLERLGLTEPDATANAIENILPKYRESQGDQIGEAEYLADLKAVLGGLNAGSQPNRKLLTAEALITPFIRATNAHSGETTLVTPHKTWLPTTEIKVFVKGNPNVWLVDQRIADEFREQLVELGAHNAVKPRFEQPRLDGHVRVTNDWGRHERGLEGFDPGTVVEELEFALTHPDLERSLFIWNEILLPHVRLLSGKVETSTRQDYSNAKSEFKYSRLGEQVRRHGWVPARDMQWKAPGETEREELHANLRLDEPLLNALGVRSVATLSKGQATENREFYAQSLGIEVSDVELIRFIKQHSDEFAKFRIRLETRTATNSPHVKPAFPVGKSHDPARREQGIIDQLDAADIKEYETRERSVRTSSPTIEQRTLLKSRYTNDDQQLICQICKDVMPFKKRDGEYYFEAVEALNGDHFSKEHEAQYLALCPVCAAMYTEFVKRDPAAMQRVANALLATQEPEIPLEFGDFSTSLRFVDVHFLDLKTILNLSAGIRATNQVPTDRSAP